jgi:hypothetical protein
MLIAVSYEIERTTITHFIHAKVRVRVKGESKG